MSDQPMAKPACEHSWVHHIYNNLSVRLCMLCHEPDWDDLRRMLGDTERYGRALERADIVQLSVKCSAVYPANPEPPYMRPFADRLTELPAGWPGGSDV